MKYRYFKYRLAKFFKALLKWGFALQFNFIVSAFFVGMATPIFPSLIVNDKFSRLSLVPIAILAFIMLPLENRLLKNYLTKTVEVKQKRAKHQAEVDAGNRANEGKIKRDEQKRAKLQAEVDAENRAIERKIQQEVVQSSRCRIPKDADDFEEVCAEWMRRNGFPDAQKTPKGPDGGIDVLSANAVAQSKFHPSSKVSAPDIQALAGSRQQHRRRIAVFFHYGPGYSDQAIEAARMTRVRLYQLDVNSKSMKLISGGPQA